MGRGVYRGLHSSLFDDPDFQHLSHWARHVFLTLRLCRDAGPAVIFRYYPEVIARQTGLTLARVETSLVELEQTRWVLRDGVVLWVRNGLRHDPQIRLGSLKHRAAVIRQLEGLPKVPMLATFCEYYELGEAITRLSRNGTSSPPSSEKEKDSAVDSLTAAESGTFEEFYALYPRKKAPAAARRAWSLAVKKTPPPEMINALRRQLPEFSRRPSDRIPYPATWLNGESWNNEPDALHAGHRRDVNDPWKGKTEAREVKL